MAQKLPKNLLVGLYRPEYEPAVDALNEAQFDPVAIAEALEAEVARKVQEATSSLGQTKKNSKKLSPEESEALDAHILALDDQIDYTRNRISKFKDYINDQVRASSGGELAFTMNIAKKPILRKAVVNVFGKKVSTITYSMYLEAREAKKLIEEQQGDEYLAADWES